MKEYLKPVIEDEEIVIEDIMTGSSLSTEDSAPIIGDGGDNVEMFSWWGD